MANYSFLVHQFDWVEVSGDVQIDIIGYLADSSGTPFLLSSGALDLITVSTRKSQLPTGSSPPYYTFLSGLAQQAVNIRYTFSTQGTLTNNSNVISGMASTASVVIGLSVVGPGTQANTVVTSVPSTTSITVNSNATRIFTANVTSPSLSLTGTTNANQTISSILPNTNALVVGNTVTGEGIPPNTTITLINDTSTITISQDATSAETVALNFSVNPQSFVLSSVSPAILNSTYQGITVNGNYIPANDTISLVNSANNLTMSTQATATAFGVTITMTGSGTLNFAPSNWTIDFTSIQHIINVVNLANI